MGCRLFLFALSFTFCNVESQSKGLRNILLAQITGTSNNTDSIDTDEIDSAFLFPEDFERGSMIEATDVGDVNVDAIAESGKFEGDIDLRGLPYEAYVDKVIDDSPYKTDNEIGASAVRNKWFHWPNAEIPYDIATSSFSRQDRGVIASAIADYNKYTCIRWVPRQSHHRDYVRFISGKGCSSAIGKSGGRQNLSLGRGCVTKGIAIHEMIHAAGFFHEQARADRNDYVTILWDNIQPWARGNFKRMTLEMIDHLGTSYDYRSVMHYGKKYFSRNGKDTIVVKDSSAKVGQRGGLSDGDIEELNKLYGCPSTRKPVTTPRPVRGSRICADENEHCEGWAKYGYCPISSYARKHCNRACKVCRTESDCFDRKRYCEYWKLEGYCLKTYVAYMNKYCPKACEKC